MLFGNQKKIDVSVPVGSTGPPVSMRQVLAHLKVPPRARVRLCLRAGRDVLSQAHAPCVCAARQHRASVRLRWYCRAAACRGA
jgi:hypothetical protein